MIDAGKLTPARPAPRKLVIVPRSPRSLRFARAAVPVVPMIDGGKLTARPAPGKLVIVDLAACRGPRGPYGSHVLPCPSIDNREADTGQAGHR